LAELAAAAAYPLWVGSEEFTVEQFSSALRPDSDKIADFVPLRFKARARSMRVRRKHKQTILTLFALGEVPFLALLQLFARIEAPSE
jgi:hypothetical protein